MVGIAGSVAMNPVGSARTGSGAVEQANRQTRYTRALQIPLEGIFRFVGPVMKATGAAGTTKERVGQVWLYRRCVALDPTADRAWEGAAGRVTRRTRIAQPRLTREPGSSTRRGP